jgi:hypothetical protein
MEVLETVTFCLVSAPYRPHFIISAMTGFYGPRGCEPPRRRENAVSSWFGLPIAFRISFAVAIVVCALHRAYT